MSHSGQQIRGFWNIMRPIDGVVMGIGFIVAMVLAGSIQLEVSLVFYIYVFFGAFFVTAHAMVVNDIIDLEIDKINEPNRVLPSGMLSIKLAKIFAIILMLAGMFSFILIDLGGYLELPYLWVFVLGHIALADIYNRFLKGTGFIGNIVVAENSYALFLASDLFLNGSLTLIPQMVGITGFCASLSREIYKGIIDQKGDDEHGVRTVAVLLGAKKAKYLASFILSVCIILISILFPFVDLIGKIGVVLVVLLLSYTLYLAKDAERPMVSRKVKKYILIAPLLISPFLIIDRLIIL